MTTTKLENIYEDINNQMARYGVVSLNQLNLRSRDYKVLESTFSLFKPFSIIVEGKKRDFLYFLDEKKLYWHLTRLQQPLEVFVRASTLYPKFARYFQERLQKARFEDLLEEMKK